MCCHLGPRSEYFKFMDISEALTEQINYTWLLIAWEITWKWAINWLSSMYWKWWMRYAAVRCHQLTVDVCTRYIPASPHLIFTLWDCLHIVHCLLIMLRICLFVCFCCVGGGVNFWDILQAHYLQFLAWLEKWQIHAESDNMWSMMIRK